MRKKTVIATVLKDQPRISTKSLKLIVVILWVWEAEWEPAGKRDQR